VQLRLPWNVKRPSTQPTHLVVAGQPVPVAVVRHRLARRYVVRVTTEGVRLTVPRGATIAGGLAFAVRQSGWLEREWRRQRDRLAPWLPGTVLWFRGEQVVLSIADGRVRVGAEVVDDEMAGRNLRTTVEPWMRRLADRELPARCLELSDKCRLTVARVVVGNQRSRWGTCSPKRVISLNWRLIQMPPDVSDYIILHELMHLKQPNHSRRFWREVDAVCAWWRSAEHWLRRHGRELM
jgi:predicted metal-dependent hydrolase